MIVNEADLGPSTRRGSNGRVRRTRASVLALLATLVALEAHADELGLLRGVVTDAQTGKGIAGVTVNLMHNLTFPSGQTAVTNTKGEFEMGRVQPAVYGIELVAPDRSDYVTEAPFPVRVGENKVTVLRRGLSKGGELLVRFRRPDGTSWDTSSLENDVRLTIFDAANNEILERPSAWTFEITQLLAHGVPPGSELSIEVHANGFVPRTHRGIVVQVGQRTVFDVVLDPNEPIGIEGFVEPWATVDVYVAPNGPYVGLTQANGVGFYTMLGLSPGTYALYSNGAALGEVVVRAGERTRSGQKRSGAQSPSGRQAASPAVSAAIAAASRPKNPRF